MDLVANESQLRKGRETKVGDLVLFCFVFSLTNFPMFLVLSDESWAKDDDDDDDFQLVIGSSPWGIFSLEARGH